MSRRREDPDPIESAVKVGAVIVIAAVMGIRGCVVRSDLPKDLTEIQTDTQIYDDAQRAARASNSNIIIPELERVPGTTFEIDGKKFKFLSFDTEATAEQQQIEEEQFLEEGLNVIELECHRRNGVEKTYNLRGAFGSVKIGQNVSYAGSQDDVRINRPNGESLAIKIDCPGGKHGNDISKVFIEIDH